MVGINPQGVSTQNAVRHYLLTIHFLMLHILILNLPFYHPFFVFVRCMGILHAQSQVGEILNEPLGFNRASHPDILLTRLSSVSPSCQKQEKKHLWIIEALIHNH